MNMAHSNPKKINPSFFKLLFDTTSPYLSIPPVFVQKHLSSRTIPETVVLQTIQLGRKWTVKTAKIGGKLCFGKGWLDFVNDTKTEVGDLVSFWMTGKSTFKVAVFGPNGCEKKLCLSTPAAPKTKGEESVNPCCEKVIKRSHRHTMRFPMKFVKESGIGRHEYTMLRNESGREWEVKLLKFADERVSLGSGWFDFKKENKIKEGDTCKFKYFQSDQGSRSSISSFIEVEVEVVKKVKK